MEKYGFIYIWYDKKRKMFYIGSHWGREDDGYICSSKWMRDAYRYRKQDFRRRTLKRDINREDLLKEEYYYFQMIKDEELGKRYYNLNRHHFGHWQISEHSRKSVRKKLSEASKKLHQDSVYKQKFLEGRKKLPSRSKEAIRKTALANTGKKRTEETKRKISESNKGKVLGPLSDEHRKKVSESLQGNKNPFYGKQHDPELKKQMNAKTSATLKGKRPKNLDMFVGTFWWNNGSINKRSSNCPGDDWTKGKIRKA